MTEPAVENLRRAAAPLDAVKMYADALAAANARIAELEARLGEQQSRSFRPDRKT
jgi:hypothetical protein